MDIVERLRGDYSDERLRLAADEIERLQEEHHDVRILNEQYYNENAILIDEIERLREAHEKIIAMANKPNKRIRDAVVISQAALQQDVSQMTRMHDSHAQMSDDKGQR